MAINISVQYNGGFLPDIILLTQGLLPSGNPFKYHVETLSLQPTRYETVYYYCHHVGCCTALFLFCFCFLSGVSAWRLM